MISFIQLTKISFGAYILNWILPCLGPLFSYFLLTHSPFSLQTLYFIFSGLPICGPERPEPSQSSSHYLNLSSSSILVFTHNWVLSPQTSSCPKEMATSSIMAWKSADRGSLVGYSPLGCKELGITEQLGAYSLLKPEFKFYGSRKLFVEGVDTEVYTRYSKSLCWALSEDDIEAIVFWNKWHEESFEACKMWY